MRGPNRTDYSARSNVLYFSATWRNVGVRGRARGRSDFDREIPKEPLGKRGMAHIPPVTPRPPRARRLSEESTMTFLIARGCTVALSPKLLVSPPSKERRRSLPQKAGLLYSTATESDSRRAQRGVHEAGNRGESRSFRDAFSGMHDRAAPTTDLLRPHARTASRGHGARGQPGRRWGGGG